jgi:molecular chaperone GrpE
MAVSLSSSISFYTPRISTSNPSKPLELKTLAFRPHAYYSQSLLAKFAIRGSSSYSTLSPIRSRRCFKSYASADEPIAETSEEDEVIPEEAAIPETEVELESPSEMKSLLTVYKQAILNGDEKTSFEIEEAISAIEDEKKGLSEKVLVLSGEVSTGKERYLRLQADFDNFRKRSDKERLSVRSNAQGEVIESLLPMVDNFERAKQQLKLETEQEKKIDASYQGIYKQFVEIMRGLQVAIVETVGKPFDPSLHEAIAREESEEFEDGIVLQEFRRGFLLGDRLLRPAMVKVSAGPGKKQSPTPTTTPVPETVEEEDQIPAEAAATVEEHAT